MSPLPTCTLDPVAVCFARALMRSNCLAALYILASYRKTMSKRSSVPDDDSSSSASSTSKKRVVSMATVDKWILDHDKILNSATWLTYEKADRHHVALLLCSVQESYATFEKRAIY